MISPFTTMRVLKIFPSFTQEKSVSNVYNLRESKIIAYLGLTFSDSSRFNRRNAFFS